MDCTDIFKGGSRPDRDNPVFRMVVKAMTEEALNAYDALDGKPVDVTLTLNGVELDVHKAFRSLFNQMERYKDEYDRHVNKAAKQLLADKFTNVVELLDDLESRVMPEIEVRLEDWEKEE